MKGTPDSSIVQSHIHGVWPDCFQYSNINHYMPIFIELVLTVFSKTCEESVNGKYNCLLHTRMWFAM